jgi:hypothetical protein
MRQASIRQSWDPTGRSNEHLQRHLVSPVPSRTPSRAALAAGLVASCALLPLAWARGSLTRRRVPRLPPAQSPHHGKVSGAGNPIRVVAIGESTVSGIGLARGDETVAATTALALARLTRRAAVWRAYGLGGALPGRDWCGSCRASRRKPRTF